MTCKTKSIMTKKKAFTLIELLIVIAIIGILFIVLVSKVDFATDKAKATGVQTDFRSFQVAIETVAKEHAGLATFGWDTGDANGDRIRNSYDAGDTNQDGVRQDGEVWTGRKVYAETWTNVYTLTNPADSSDTSAIFELESAINKNLDPKLHITINNDYTITMANQAMDPWNTEYHGYYITNATADKKDRGAIVIYSNGANQEFGSEHSISNGVVVVNVPGNNVYGKDDYSIAIVYTYVNGYGEVKTTTSGFSNNQGGNQTGSTETVAPGNDIQSELLEQYNGNAYKVTNSLSTGVNYDDLDTSIIMSYGIPEDIANSYRDASQDINTAVKMQDLLVIKDGEIYLTYGYYFKHLDAFVSLYTEKLSISNEVSIDIDDSSLVLLFGAEQIESTIYDKTIIEPSECSWTLAVATGRYIIGSAIIFVNTIEFVDIGSSSVSYVGNVMWNVSIDEAKFNVDNVITSTTLDSYCLDLFDYDLWNTALQNNDVDAFENYSYILIVPVI